MIKEKKRQEDLTYVSSQLSKKLKSSFGKGPDSCFSTFESNMLFIHIRKFITPSEEVLLKKDKKGLALKFRTVILEAILDDLKPELTKVFKVSFSHFFQDWNFETNTGLILIMSKYQKTSSILMVEKTLTNKVIEEKIETAYIETYKKPNNINFTQLNENIYIAECDKILLPVEMELYKQGNHELLLKHSNEIKRRLTEYKPLFTTVFRRMVNEIYIMWDYNGDKNIIVFFVK